MSKDLGSYYARRAAEFDRIYEKPERQHDLEILRGLVRDALEGHHVLELACGTGYWTAVVSEVAKSVVATDAVPKVLSVARQRRYPSSPVHFKLLDAYELPNVEGQHSAIFSGFWWSHIPRQRLATFLKRVNDSVGGGVRAVYVDNRYIAGSSTPVATHDPDGNTFQVRRLSDGSEHKILKNFPDAAELHAAVAPYGEQVIVKEMTYYWFMSFTTLGAG